MVQRDLREKRNDPGWFRALADRTGRWAGALTVAGQWRSFTAFPSILAIAVVFMLPLSRGNLTAWKRLPYHEHFIAKMGGEVKAVGATFCPVICGPRRESREKNGDPGMIRTCDKQFRKLLLYPPELRGHVDNIEVSTDSHSSSTHFNPPE